MVLTDLFSRKYALHCIYGTDTEQYTVHEETRKAIFGLVRTSNIDWLRRAIDSVLESDWKRQALLAEEKELTIKVK